MSDVEGDFASGRCDRHDAAAEPRDATPTWTTRTGGRQARIRLGQFKPQIGLEQTLLDLQSDYMERGLRAEHPGRQRHQLRPRLHGLRARPRSGTWYAVTVSNGTGQNLEEKQATAPDAANSDSKDVTVRGVLDFAQILAVKDADPPRRRGLQSGVSRRIRRTPSTAFQRARGPHRGARPDLLQRRRRSTRRAGNASASRPPEISGRRNCCWRNGPVKLQGEYCESANRPEGTRFAPASGGGVLARDINAGLHVRDVVDHPAKIVLRLTTGISIPQKIKPRNGFGRGDGQAAGAPGRVGVRLQLLRRSATLRPRATANPARNRPKRGGCHTGRHGFHEQGRPPITRRS